MFKYPELYALEMFGKKGAISRVYLDLIVLDGTGNIMVANVIGADKAVKQTSEYLQAGKSGKFFRAEGSRSGMGTLTKSVYGISGKKNYDEQTIKIDDLTQSFFVTKQAKPDIKLMNSWIAAQQESMREGNEREEVPYELAEVILAWDGDHKAQVYKILDDRYNTPLLPEWSDFIYDELVSRGFYTPLDVFTFGSEYTLEAGLLRVSEFDLEEIIGMGVRTLELDFAIKEDGRSVEEAILPQLTSIDRYLSEFASDLGERIQENIGLHFDPDNQKHHASFRDVNLTANEHGITGLYPPQANTVMGVANTLQKDKFCFIVGEMGTGKTTMGEIVPYIAEAMSQNVDTKPKPKRVIVMSPAIMVEKWAREIKERIPGAKTFQINHWEDVNRIKKRTEYVDAKGKVKYKDPETWEYYIMSSEAPKFTYPIEAIRDWRTHKNDLSFKKEDPIEDDNARFVRRGDGVYRVRNVEEKIRMTSFDSYDPQTYESTRIYATDLTGYYCPKCGGLLRKRNGNTADNTFFDNYNPKTKTFTKKQTQENLYCTNKVETSKMARHEIKERVKHPSTQKWVPAEYSQECGFVLWRPEILPADSGYRKVSPAWFINKQLPRGFFKYLIADEVHEYKDGKSAIGQAFGQLVNHTEKQILLTGTLMGGMSRDIFYLLARLNPKGLAREHLSYTDQSAFNSRYGITEWTTKIVNGKERKTSAQKPGISPHLFPMHLMSNCAFLELNDMGYALPPYQEIPVLVDMHHEHQQAYRNMTHEIIQSMSMYDGMTGMNGVSIYMNASYQYADAPFNVSKVVAYDEYGVQRTLADPHSFTPGSFLPRKVEELMENIDRELENPAPLIDAEGNEVDSPPRRSLVYVKYTGKDSWNQMDTYLYDVLKARGYKVGILKNGGSYDGIKMPKNSRAREEWLHAMMEKHDWDVLITNPRLVKVGLDLLMFPNIHFFQLDYSTYDYMQASRRSWRLKQTLPVKVFTYVYRNTIQDKGLQHMARKIDAAMAMQGKFSEEGLRAMADSSDGMTALAKQLMSDNLLDDLETVHDMFARKNSSFEEMQSVEFQSYEGYVMNPIEGGMETVRNIAMGMIRHAQEEGKAGRMSEKEVERKVRAVTDYLTMFDEVLTTVENVREYNKGLTKKAQIIEGQQELDIFAL